MEIFVLMAVLMVMALPLLGLMYALWRDNSITPLVVAINLGLFLLLCFAVFDIRNRPIVAVLICVVVVVYLCTPLFGSVWERNTLKRMIEEDIERYRKAVEYDPKNAAAHAYLGEAYLKQKRYDEAIAEFETAVQLMPERSQKERCRLRMAIEAKAREELRMVLCEHCRKEIPASSRICPCCGERARAQFLVWLSQPEFLKEVLKTSAICMVVITLLVPCLRILPPPVVGILIMTTLIVGAVILFRSFDA